jgi:hypothetical protein
MATLGPGQAALFIGPAHDCKVEHTDHRNSLCVIVAIELDANHTDGHVVLCRAQDGTLGYARPDELKLIDDWGVDTVEHKEVPETANAGLQPGLGQRQQRARRAISQPTPASSKSKPSLLLSLRSIAIRHYV